MSEFQREDRYIVLKRSDLNARHPKEIEMLGHALTAIGRSSRQYLVIESDWPEYEPVWQMIERRMAGQPAVTAAEELEAVLHWREKHGQAIKERDALQLRLNAADQRIDELVAQLATVSRGPCKLTVGDELP